MADASVAAFVRTLGQVVLEEARRPSDGELLERFLQARDERAFASLVGRHGTMVLGVCRRVLGDAHDAEDAFQAVFLVLARRADSIRPRDNVGNWLHGVAHRTALEAQKLRARRRAREHQVETMPEPAWEQLPAWESVRPILDEEIARLPARYRTVVVLCDLEGRSRKEAALLAGVPEGTLSSRLARARQMLAGRLARRGVTASTSLLATILTREATASAPRRLMTATVQAVCDTAGSSGTVDILTRGVLKTMFLSKVKLTCVTVLVALFIGTGGLYLLWGGEQPKQVVLAAPEPPPRERPMKRNETSIEGTWAMVKASANGTHLPQEVEKDQRWVITTDAIIILHADNSEVAFRYHLHPDKQADAIDLWPLRFEGNRFKGIYELKGDVLTIRYTRNQHPTATRPTELGPDNFAFDRGARYFVLRREKVNVKVPPNKPHDEQKVVEEDVEWSRPINGLRGRLVLRPRGENNGTKILGLDLQLQNVTTDTMRVVNDPGDIRVQVFDAVGKATVKESGLPRSGPVPNPSVCVLPRDAYLGFALDTTTVGIPRDRPALLPLHSQDWILEPGKYVITATYSVAKTKIRPEGVWLGTMELPPIVLEVK